VATILANGLFKPKTPYKHQDFIPDFEVEEVSLEEKEAAQASMWKAQLNNDKNES
jgi:hypothetical protein